MNNYPFASMRDCFDMSAYFVVGPQDCKGRPVTDVVDDALRGGATFIQLRAKDADAKDITEMARDIAQIIEDNGKSDSVAFVIDDRTDVVWQARNKGIKVDGVHIGQTDMEPREARALLGEDAIVGLSAETESLVKLINELPNGCIDYIGAGPLHVSTTKPEASVGGNDGSGHTLDEEQINTICTASEFPVVVGGGVKADDMEMLARSKAAGWFVVSAIAGADDPENATREMVTRWKAVRGDKKHGYAPRVKAAVEETEKPAETGEKKFTNAKEAKAASKLAKQQRVDIAARDSKQRDKAHIRKTTPIHFENEHGSYDLQVPYTEIKLSDTPGVGPNAPFKDYNTEGPKCDPKLRRGTLYLIGENTLHRTITTGFHARYVLHIGRRALAELSTPQTDFTRLAQSSFLRAPLSNEQMTHLVELFQALERNKDDGSFGSDIRQITALLELLLWVAPALHASSAGEAIQNKDFMRVSPILDYIRARLSEPLTLDQIAGEFFISKHYLCRIFKSATGFSVMEYIIYSRVLMARQLLQQGVSVQQAGEMSGFSDNSHFIRTFGHLTGTSPGRYAKEYQRSDQVLLKDNIVT